MQLRKRLTSLLLLFAMLLPCLCIAPPQLFSVNAATATTAEKHTKKIVSVLYDNSGSMNNSADKRQFYAEYSMQMLIALLSPTDELFITPMNVGYGSGATVNTSKNNSLTKDDIDLSSPDRQSVIQSVMADKSIFHVDGPDTPGDTIAYAVEHLCDNGLKDRNNLASAEENVEHWLIIMTDGLMSSKKLSITASSYDSEEKKIAKAEQIIESNIKNYPTLKTVYMTFGEGVNLAGSSLESKYAFTPYKAASPDGVADVMQKIANQISGRYPYAATNYTASGSTVTVNLDNLPYALKSISVVAQDCGVTLKKASYQGKNLAMLLPCTITPSTKLNMKNGYTAKIEGDPYFTEGKLTLTFSGTVKAEDLSILVEPALEIRPYFEHWSNNRWERVDAQFVNENLTTKDRLRVGYELYELTADGSGKKIDIDKIFAPNEAKITYGGEEYEVNEELKLKKGVHEVAISVSVLNGTYKMYASVLCAILDNPKDYYLEIACKDMMSNKETSTTASCTVFFDKLQVGATALNNYTCTAKLIAPNGTSKDITATRQNGKFVATVTPTPGLYGDYTVYFKVISPDGFFREKTHTLSYTAMAIGIGKSGADTAPSGSTQATVDFWGVLDGNKMTKSQLNSFDWSVSATLPDGKATTVTPTLASDGTVSCRLAIDSKYYGLYTVTFRISDGAGTEKELSHTVAYRPASLTVEGNYLDAMPAGETKTSFVYTVKMNGTALTKAEVEKYSYTFSFTDPLGRPVSCTGSVGADGKITFPIDLSSTGYGNYNATFTFTVDDGCKAEDKHTLSNFPATMVVQTVGGSSITMSEQQLLDGGKGMEFALLLNGSPASFATGGITYRLMAGGKDVTANATVNGDRLLYTPSAADIGSTHGEKSVTLYVDFSGAPALSTQATVTVTVSETAYLVEVVSGGKPDIDRFALSEVDAILYFRVLRDGTALTAEQLQEALDSGALRVSDGRGTFTWQFWLPTGYTVEVLSVGGEPLLAVRATRDWMKPLDSFAAMFIFDGDKPITATYGGAEATDAFRFAPSPAWEYIWRALVILLFIYICLYVFGFFNGKCKSLPAGRLLQISVYESKREEITADTVPVNETFFKRYGWHIRRFFIPFYKGKFLWYHQPSQNIGGVVVMECNDDGVAKFVFDHSEMFPLTVNDDGSEAADLFFRTLLSMARKGDNLNDMDPKVRSGELRDLLYREAETQNIQENKQASISSYYGRFENGRTLSYAMKFLATK